MKYTQSKNEYKTGNVKFDCDICGAYNEIEVEIVDMQNGLYCTSCKQCGNDNYLGIQ